MIGLVLLLVALLLFAYRHYAARKSYWADRGVPGPKPEFLLGNLRAFLDPALPRAIVLKNWTEEYGKVYGCLEGQQPIRVVSDASLINEIFVKRFDSFNATAKLGLQGTVRGKDTHMAQASGAQWKRLRTLSTDAFSFIERKGGAEIEAQRYFREYTMDIISKLTLGMDDCRMFENELIEWPRSSFIFIAPAVFPFLVPFLKVFFVVATLFVQIPILALTKHVRNVVEERKKQKAAGASSKNDILEMFLEAESDDVGEGAKNRLTADEIVANCKLFLLAGFDTTSITLAKAVHFLANHSEVQQSLREEVDEVIGDEDYGLEDVNNLRYAEAVIKETLRHHPIASGFTTRECTADCEIGEHFFKKGDVIVVDSFSLQMDKELWGEDAEEFRPERWLENTTRDRAAFLAFGEGPRICLGMKLAIVEAKVALVEILRKFTVEKSENTKPLKMVGSILVAFEKVPVIMKNR